jgi:hypothetical protein
LVLPSPALAQRGHPIHGGGTHVVVAGGVYYGAPYYYPYAYPWYPFGFWYPAPYYYGPYYYDNSASLQLQVTPRQTEVFVDGHFAASSTTSTARSSGCTSNRRARTATVPARAQGR